MPRRRKTPVVRVQVTTGAGSKPRRKRQDSAAAIAAALEKLTRRRKKRGLNRFNPAGNPQHGIWAGAKFKPFW